MAIHYDAKLKRFRDDSGRLVSRDRAWRSSVARAEFAKAQKVSRAKPKAVVKPPPKAAPPKKVPAKKAAAKKVTAKKAAPSKGKKPAQHRVFPWEVSGVVREYPDPQEWFPDFEEPDYDYDYDDLADDWGDFEDEDTTS